MVSREAEDFSRPAVSKVPGEPACLAGPGAAARRPAGRWLSAAAALAAMLLCAAPTTPAADKTATSAPAKTFTVATYNINWGNPNLKAVAATIAKSKADLVCLQETNRDSALYLRRRLGRTYPHIAFRNTGGAGGLGFLSKSPIRHLKYVPRKFGWFGAWVVKVALAGADVQVAGVHLMPTDLRRARSLVDVLRQLFKSEAVRLAEIRHVHASLAAKTPTIVLGDFNTFSSYSAPQFLLGQGFADSFASVTKDPDAHPTWHGRVRAREWRFRIDYIFHTADVATVSSRVVPSGGSDHYLLVSTLRWAPKPAEPPAGDEGKGSESPD